MYSDKAYKLNYSMGNDISNEPITNESPEQIPYLTERASDKYSQIKSMQQVAMNKLQAMQAKPTSNDDVMQANPVKPIGDSDD